MPEGIWNPAPHATTKLTPCPVAFLFICGQNSMEKPLPIEIVAYAPTAFYHCMHCEVVWQEIGFSNNIRKEQAASGLPPDIAQEYQSISDWVHKLFRDYCDRVTVKVIDAASAEGFWKTLRYGLHSYPAVIVDGRYKFTGSDFFAAHQEIARLLEATPAA
jgi:hypothetical protein